MSLSQDFSLNARRPDLVIDAQGRSFLHIAAEEGDIAAVQLALDSGAHACLFTENDAQCTPAMLAAKNGHVEILNLLARAVPLTLKDINPMGETPLSLAVRGGHDDCIHALIALGADAAASTAPASPLYRAYVQGRLDLAQRFEALGADIRLHDSLPELLGEAMKLPTIEVLETLIGMTDAATIHARAQKTGNAALHTAVLTENIDAAAVLIAAGAIVNQPNKEGLSPLQLAIAVRNEELMHMLIVHGGADPAHAAAGSYRTPLQAAVVIGDLAMVEALVELGADVCAAQEADKHPLVLAAERGTIAIADYLMTHLQAHPDAAEAKTIREKALEKAITQGRTGVVEVMLRHRARSEHIFDLNTHRENGETYMTLAVRQSSTTLIQYLLNAGADITQPTLGGTDARAIAEESAIPVLKETVERAWKAAENGTARTARLHQPFRTFDDKGRPRP